jgi:hypothetical protein
MMPRACGEGSLMQTSGTVGEVGPRQRVDARADAPVDIGRRKHPLGVAALQLLMLGSLLHRMLSKQPEWWPAALALIVLTAISIVYCFSMAPYPRFRVSGEGMERYRWSSRAESIRWSDIAGSAEVHGFSVCLAHRGGGWVRWSTFSLSPEETEQLRCEINRRLDLFARSRRGAVG